ncbi:hypothetical protein H1P_830022 [Hyella patelloides LEGE 07179]|uniref:Uncharacterized protein n=1 Tax=Hyella patelloides LEGE 07179 TaxID=945734 RepID=A0A563W4P3_9CYAN|nr:hypothetical protein H1P_830022 [Hyella patelloides LEGE 07179]
MFTSAISIDRRNQRLINGLLILPLAIFKFRRTLEKQDEKPRANSKAA